MNKKMQEMIEREAETTKLGQPGLYERAIAYTNYIEGAQKMYDILTDEHEKKMKVAMYALKYYQQRCKPCNSMYDSHEEGFKNDQLQGCDCLIARSALDELETEEW